MENMMKRDEKSLRGEYLRGFNEVKKALNSTVIGTEFKVEVESDILELFIRNQENNKAFDEVVGEDVHSFIRDIVDVYLDELSTKTKLLNSFGVGLLISGLFFFFDFFTGHPASMASLIMIAGTFVVVTSVTFISYKIGKKIKPKNVGYISGAAGFAVSFISRYLYDSVEVIKKAAEQSIDFKSIVVFVIIEIVIGIIILKKCSKED